MVDIVITITKLEYAFAQLVIMDRIVMDLPVVMQVARAIAQMVFAFHPLESVSVQQDIQELLVQQVHFQFIFKK